MITKEQAERLRKLVDQLEFAVYWVAKEGTKGTAFANYKGANLNFASYLDEITEK